MAWAALIPLAAAAIGAVGSYSSARQAKKASQKGTRTSGTITNEPWGPAVPGLNELMGGALDLFRSGYTPRINARGGGGGPSSEFMDFAGQVINRAMSPSPFLGMGEGQLGTMFGDPYGGNTFLRGLGEALPGWMGGVQDYVGGIGDYVGGLQGEAGLSSGLFNSVIPALLGNILGGTDIGTSQQASGGSGGFNFGPSGQGLLGGGGGPNQYMREVLEGKWLERGNPYLSDMIDAFGGEAIEQYQRSIVPQIDSQYIRAGRQGPGMYASAHAQANEEVNEAIQNNIAGLLGGQYQFERGNMMDALGLLSQQEIAGMQAGASGAATAAAAQAADRDRALRERLGLLGAGTNIASLLDSRSRGLLGGGLEGLGLGLQGMGLGLGGLELGERAGEGLNQFRLGGLSLIPGMEESRLYGPLSAFGIMSGVEQQRQAARSAGAGRRMQADMFNAQAPYQRINELAGILFPMAQLGGVQRQQGTNMIPYQGPSPVSSGLGGAASGGMFGLGLSQVLGGKGKPAGIYGTSSTPGTINLLTG